MPRSQVVQIRLRFQNNFFCASTKYRNGMSEREGGGHFKPQGGGGVMRVEMEQVF